MLLLVGIYIIFQISVGNGHCAVPLFLPILVYRNGTKAVPYTKTEDLRRNHEAQFAVTAAHGQPGTAVPTAHPEGFPA